MKSAKYATFFMGLAIINTINAHEASPPLQVLSIALMLVSIAIAWYHTFVQQERAA